MHGFESGYTPCNVSPQTRSLPSLQLSFLSSVLSVHVALGWRLVSANAEPGARHIIWDHSFFSTARGSCVSICLTDAQDPGLGPSAHPGQLVINLEKSSLFCGANDI